MLQALMSGFRLVVAGLGLITPSDLASIGALGVTIALVTAAVVLVAGLCVTVPDARRASSAHPARAIDVSSPLAQSDPDASGHARPRAPGLAVPAA